MREIKHATVAKWEHQRTFTYDDKNQCKETVHCSKEKEIGREGRESIQQQE